MDELAIDRAEVWVVGPETERYAWALEMGEQFMAQTIVRLTTKGGLQGIAGAAMCSSHAFDRSVGETLRYLLPEVMGRSPLEREALWRLCERLTDAAARTDAGSEPPRPTRTIVDPSAASAIRPTSRAPTRWCAS